jgi:hypothetical protein
MIEWFSGKEEYGSCRTTGCSCCSCDLNPKEEKDKILREARDNVRVVKKICEFYKIDFKKFCSDILTEKQCKKHKFYKKYANQEVCWKCDFWKLKEIK